jgi:hypothetical protein
VSRDSFSAAAASRLREGEKSVKSPFKLTVTDKRDGDCEVCHEGRTIYEAKFENGFSALLCIGCLESQIDYRKEKAEGAGEPPRKE